MTLKFILGRMAMSRPFMVTVLLMGMGLASAGAATRTTLGRDQATWLLAAGASVLFMAWGVAGYAVLDPALTRVSP